MRSKSPNNKEKDTTGTKAEKNDLFPEMTDENWKPSFMEVVRSKSWTEHLTAYIATFGVLLYLILSPEDWTGWALTILSAAGLAIGYWVAMVNFNRCYLQKANRRLLQERRRLDRIEKELQEVTRRLESTETKRETPNK